MYDITVTASDGALSSVAQAVAITVTNVNGTTLTVSSPITLASGSELTFVGYPEVLVKWNQGYHSYAFATGI